MGDELKKHMKKALKIVVRTFLFPIIIITLIVIFIFILLASFVYFITIDDGTYKEDDWSSPGFGASVYRTQISVAENGGLSLGQTPQEIWDEMIKNGSCVDDYLDTPEQLEKLMNAEVVTQYPYIGESLGENELQGTIKFKRVDTSGREKNLKYIAPDEFQKMVDEGNSNVMNYFTIENKKTSSGSSSNSTSRPIADGVLCWPSELKENSVLTSGVGPRWGTYHNGLDIAGGNFYGTDVYACERGTVKYASYDGGWNGGAGNWVVIDHGNGYTSIYMHNSKVVVNVGDEVNKGQKIAEAGSTGYSTGPHIHFQIEYNGQIQDPEDFEYEISGLGNFGNPNGGGFGVDSSSYENKGKENDRESSTSQSSSSSVSSSCYVKVATWEKITTTVQSNVPEHEGESKSTYNISVQKLDYEELVKKYTLPFDLLWAFLVVGDNKDFVLELADLAYNSEIEIMIQENYKKTTDVETWTYTQEYKNDVTATVTEVTTGITDTVSFTKTSENPCETIKTIITETNTLNYEVTKADIWYMYYEKGYEITESGEIDGGGATVTLDDTNFSEKPSVSNSFDDERINALVSSVSSQAKAKESKKLNIIKDINVNTYTRYKGIQKANKINIEEKNVVSTPASIKEKIDEETAPNFVTIFRDSDYTNKTNIRSAKSWLFEIIEKNESTANMTDLIKYLLYKSTGVSYGVTEFDFTVFDTNSFQTISEGDNWDKFIKMIKSFEGGFVYDSTKTKYKIIDDGYGHPTVGWGLDIYKSGKLNELKKAGVTDFSIGAYIDVELVDRLLAEELEEKYVEVKNRTRGLNLTEYQEHALVSRAFNCGTTGAFTSYGDFVQLYKNYWNQDRDDELGKKANEKMYSHTLYTNCMKDTIYSEGQVAPGLIIRRRAEWILFKTGYYLYRDEGGEFWSEEAGSIKIENEDEEANQLQKRIVEVAINSNKYGIPAVQEYCLQWVNDVYARAIGTKYVEERKDYAREAGYYYGVSKDINNIPLGAAVYSFSSSPYGHVGIYIGNGKIISNIGGTKIETVSQFNKSYPIKCWGWCNTILVNSKYGNVRQGLCEK